MVGIHVTSEIKPLKKVLLHRPGKELLNLTPDTLGRLLFDDIPFLKVAQAEHDRFAEILRENGVEVVYLEDLMAEVLDADPAVRKEFLEHPRGRHPHQTLAENCVRSSGQNQRQQGTCAEDDGRREPE